MENHKQIGIFHCQALGNPSCFSLAPAAGKWGMALSHPWEVSLRCAHRPGRSHLTQCFGFMDGICWPTWWKYWSMCKSFLNLLSLSTFQYFSYFWFRRFRALLSTPSWAWSSLKGQGLHKSLTPWHINLKNLESFPFPLIPPWPTTAHHDPHPASGDSEVAAGHPWSSGGAKAITHQGHLAFPDGMAAKLWTGHVLDPKQLGHWRADADLGGTQARGLTWRWHGHDMLKIYIL